MKNLTREQAIKLLGELNFEGLIEQFPNVQEAFLDNRVVVEEGVVSVFNAYPGQYAGHTIGYVDIFDVNL